MSFKKVFYIFIISIFAFNFFLFSYADDENLDDNENEINYIETTSVQSVNEPSINSRSAIVLDRTSGNILYGKSENEKRKMASTTKIMTAIIVLENVNLTDIVTVSQKSAQTGGSRLGLHTNDTLTVKSLLYGLLLCSGNDAAVALAEYVGGNVENFANMMNKKAIALNLQSTHFVTPHGLDNEDHYTTAYELAKITDYALKNEIFASIVSTKNFTITINDRLKNIKNTNELLGNIDGVYGVKTGFTNGANRCLVSAIKRGELNVICIVLGADTKKDRTQDSISLINYVFSNYQMVNISEIINNQFDLWKKDNLNNFSIYKGISSNLEINYIKLSTDYIPIKINEIKDINVSINCNQSLIAPIISNTTIGNISLKINNSELVSLDIITSNTINKKNIKDYFNYFIKNYTKIIENSYN